MSSMSCGCTILSRYSNFIANVISGLLNFLDDRINENKSVDPILVIQNLAIEKSANNPCETLPNVAGQDKIQLFQAEIVDPIPRSESIETVFGTSTLERQQGNDKGAGCHTLKLLDFRM